MRESPRFQQQVLASAGMDFFPIFRVLRWVKELVHPHSKEIQVDVGIALSSACPNNVKFSVYTFWKRN